MDAKLLKIVDQIETLAIRGIGETTYSAHDLLVREALEKIEALSKAILLGDLLVTK